MPTTSPTTPSHKLLLGRDPVTGARLASQPTISRFENDVRRSALYRMGRELAACVIDCSSSPPARAGAALTYRERRVVFWTRSATPRQRLAEGDTDLLRPNHDRELNGHLWRVVLACRQSVAEPFLHLRPRGGQQYLVRGGAAPRTQLAVALLLGAIGQATARWTLTSSAAAPAADFRGLVERRRPLLAACGDVGRAARRRVEPRDRRQRPALPRLPGRHPPPRAGGSSRRCSTPCAPACASSRRTAGVGGRRPSLAMEDFAGAE